jgi:hypothetical protein
MFLARSFPYFYQNAQWDELTPTSAETVALIVVANCSGTLRFAVWITERYTQPRPRGEGDFLRSG